MIGNCHMEDKFVRKTIVSVLALLLIAAFAAVAADFNGKWVAQVPGRQGTMEQTFTFKVEGSKVTGTVSTQMGETEISEGQVSGDDISFVVVRKFGEMEMKSIYKGKAAGNEIKFTMQMQGGRGGERPPVEFVAKKAS